MILKSFEIIEFSTSTTDNIPNARQATTLHF